MEAEVALVPGAAAPRDDTFARVAVGRADDELSAVALALGAVLVQAAVPFARARHLRRRGGRRMGARDQAGATRARATLLCLRSASRHHRTLR